LVLQKQEKHSVNKMEKVRWRGTWGVGDAMLALNVCHKYCYDNNIKVNLEMHWEHGEDYLHSPDDPETIIERMEWLHTKYHRPEDVTVTHVYYSDLFQHGNVNPDKQKDRFYFDSGAYDSTGAPSNHWPFKKELYRNHIKTKRIVIWTPTYNTEQPRLWKRFLTKDDWAYIISLLRREGWILVELTYRTPVKDAFEQIRKADYIFSYDGMWHYIAKNFSIPIFIPSWEGITGYACPQVVCRPDTEGVMEFVNTFTEEGRHHMDNKADKYLRELSKFYEENTTDS